MKYEVALILTIEADTYEQALVDAENIADGLTMEVADHEHVVAILEYEHDNEGQRVLYLPAVDS